MSSGENFAGWFLPIVMIFSVFIIIFVIVDRIAHSESQKDEIDALAEQDSSAQIQAVEDPILTRTIDVVENLYYIKDSRTGICFAAKWMRRYSGYLSEVDCADIPASMLHVTDTTEEKQHVHSN
jgi:hypothetical protein